MEFPEGQIVLFFLLNVAAVSQLAQLADLALG